MIKEGVINLLESNSLVHYIVIFCNFIFFHCLCPICVIISLVGNVQDMSPTCCIKCLGIFSSKSCVHKMSPDLSQNIYDIFCGTQKKNLPTKFFEE